MQVLSGITKSKFFVSSCQLHEIGDNLFKKYRELGKIPETDKEILILSSFLKSHKTHGAILLLCEKGYGEDSIILCRSILEIYIQMKYILTDTSDERITRYVDYDWVLRKNLFENLKERKELSDIPEERIIEINEKAKNFLVKYNRGNPKFNPRTWSDKNNREMAQEIHEIGLYQFYSSMCTFSHSTSRSLNEFNTNYTKQDNHELISEKYINLALCFAIDCHKKTCLEFNKMFFGGFEDQLSSIEPEIPVIINDSKSTD